jgi:hypothetical protein
VSTISRYRRLERLEEAAKHRLEPNTLTALTRFLGAARVGASEDAEHWAGKLLKAEDRETPLPGSVSLSSLVKAWREGGWEGLKSVA